MKTTLKNLKLIKLKNKDFQELQKSLELTTIKLKKSKNKKNQLIARFLSNNYIHPKTGLVTSKFKWTSREVSCQLN